MSNNDQILLLKVGFIYAVWTGYAVCLPLRTAKSSLWPRVASCLGAAAGVTASGLGLLLIAVGERGLPLLRQPLTWTAAMALNWAFWILVLIWAVTALTVERALAPSRTSPTPPTPEST